MVLAIVLIIEIKWLLFVVIFPSMVADVHRKKNKNFFNKLFSIPYVCVELLCKGGIKRYFIFNIGNLPSCNLRKLLYKLLGANIEKNVVFHFRTELRAPEKLFVGKGTIIGDNCILDARRFVKIGQNVNISSNVSIYTLQHDHRDPFFRCTDLRKASVEIDDRVWLGSNVIVLPGVHIGEGAVCCAGCVVTKDVEPYSIVAGIPAVKVAERPHNQKYEFSGESCWFY